MTTDEEIEAALNADLGAVIARLVGAVPVKTGPEDEVSRGPIRTDNPGIAESR